MKKQFEDIKRFDKKVEKPPVVNENNEGGFEGDPEIDINKASELISRETEKVSQDNLKLIDSFKGDPEVVVVVNSVQAEIKNNEQEHQGKFKNLLARIRENKAIRNSILAMSFLTLFGKGDNSKNFSQKDNLNYQSYLLTKDDISQPLDFKYSQEDLVNSIMVASNPRLQEVEILKKQCLPIKKFIDEERKKKNPNLKSIASQEHDLSIYKKAIDEQLLAANITPTERRAAEERLKKLNQMVQTAKLEIGSHVGSKEYLKKLAREMSITLEEAALHQQTRLQNLKNIKCTFVSLDDIGSNFSKTSYKNGYVEAYYKTGTNQIYAPYDDSNDARVREAIVHEMWHGITKANEGISGRAKEVLDFTYKSAPKIDNKYYSNPTERSARLNSLYMDMKKLGIKYGKEFTSEDYKILKKAYDANKLSQGSREIIETTEPEDLPRLINALAQTGDKTENYYPPEWFGDQNNDKA
jgi:hypothetical protein